MKTNICIVFLLSIVFLIVSCNTNRTATATSGKYEDDEVYYQPGDRFITEVPVVDESTAQAVNTEDDYYDPNIPSAKEQYFNSNGANNYYNNNFYNNSNSSYGWNNFSYQPNLSTMWDPYRGWHLGMNFGLLYGNSWGSSWGLGYGGYGYNSFNNPWSYNNNYGYNGWYGNSNIFSGNYYGGGYYGGGHNSPWSNYGYGNGGYPWFNYSDQSASNYTSVHRTNMSVNSNESSTYTGNTYQTISPTKQLPQLGAASKVPATRVPHSNEATARQQNGQNSNSASRHHEMSSHSTSPSLGLGRNGNQSRETNNPSARPSSGNSGGNSRSGARINTTPSPSPSPSRSTPSNGGGGRSSGGGGGGGGGGGASRRR